MKHIRTHIAFCMVLLLLMSLWGCSGTPSQPSSIPASKPSQAENDRIEPYAITPLDEPCGGAMTYEEFFSIERADTPSPERHQKPDIPLSFSFYTDGFFDERGFIWNTEHELYWANESETTSVLLYRTSENILLQSVGKHTIIWTQYIVGQEAGGRSLHRMYIPTMQIDTILDYEQSVTINTLNFSSGYSTTDFYMIMGDWYFEEQGISDNFMMLVYSTLTNQFYETGYYFTNEGIRADYLSRRDQDIEDMKKQEDIT